MLNGNAATHLGRAGLRIELCAVELVGHRRVLDELELVLEEVRLAPAQARAVSEEIQARRALIEGLLRERGRASILCSYHRRRARDAAPAPA